MFNQRFSLTLLLTAALLLPENTAAAVKINEIAWMGSTGNANAEWIELYNDGEEVSLSDWKLTGTTLNITLSGTIGAGGFYLLERTSDASVPTVSADQIYTGALSNTGDTLLLKDATGATVDEVIGGSNWENIGGDNTTKDTPQRQGSAWSTAAPTPRAQNASTASEEEGDETATTTPEVATTTPSSTVGGSIPSTQSYAKSPARVLLLDAGDSRIVLAGVSTPYRAVAYSGEGKPKDARITWSFGDGTRELGERVWHTYEEPGEYAVVVRAEHFEAHVVRTITVRVEEADITARMHPKGVVIENKSDRLVDLSGWRLFTEDREFIVPEDTALLPRGESLFSSKVTGLQGDVTLARPEEEKGLVATPYLEEKPEAPKESIEIVQRAYVPQSLPAPKEEVYEEGTLAPAAPQLQAAAGAAMPGFPWLSCLFGGLLACGASFVVR